VLYTPHHDTPPWASSSIASPLPVASQGRKTQLDGALGPLSPPIATYATG
jgi:hypothetical protein